MRFFLMIWSLVLLCACGFEPVHGTAFQSTETTAVQSILTQIEIENIPDREGQYLRNALIDRFYRTSRPSAPLYTLKIAPITEQIIDLDITKNSDATRGQLRLNSTMTLIDNTAHKEILSRPISAVASYNILTSEFATRVTEGNTRRNALDELAGDIELQITLFLKRQNEE